MKLKRTKKKKRKVAVRELVYLTCCMHADGAIFGGEYQELDKHYQNARQENTERKKLK